MFPCAEPESALLPSVHHPALSYPVSPSRPGRPRSPLTLISESSAGPSRQVKFRSSAHLSRWNLALESFAAGLSSIQNTPVPSAK